MPFLLLILFLAVSPARADETNPPQPAVVLDKYAGGFRDDYLQELSRVQTFLSLAEQNISTQLGLIQYGRGFSHPVTVGFEDGAPAVTENPFYYVRSLSDSNGFSQELVANVEAFARHRKEANWRDPDLRNGFYFAMTELMLNDIAGGDPDKVLPAWIQEGLAVYISGSGDALVEATAGKTHRSHIHELVEDLNRPDPIPNKPQWARYYLGIKYIYDTGGTNALQSFVREVLNGTSAADAVLHTLSQDWPTFQQNVKDYSAKAFLPFTNTDDEMTIQNPQRSSHRYP